MLTVWHGSASKSELKDDVKTLIHTPLNVLTVGRGDGMITESFHAEIRAQNAVQTDTDLHPSCGSVWQVWHDQLGCSTPEFEFNNEE